MKSTSRDDTAHGPRRRRPRCRRAGARGRPRDADRRRECRHRDGTRQDRGRRRHRQSGRSVRADVHDRMMTGVGRPQFTAVVECSAEAAGWASTSGPTAESAGRASRTRTRRRCGQRDVRIMVAGTYESAADTPARSDGRLYKESFGMASKPRREESQPRETELDRARRNCSKEGISSSRMYLDPARPASRTSSTRSSPACARHAVRRRGAIPSSTNGHCRDQSHAATTKVVRSGRHGDPLNGPIVVAIDGPGAARQEHRRASRRAPTGSRVPRHVRCTELSRMRRCVEGSGPRRRRGRRDSREKSNSTSTTTVSESPPLDATGRIRGRDVNSGGQRRGGQQTGCAQSLSIVNGRGCGSGEGSRRGPRHRVRGVTRCRTEAVHHGDSHASARNAGYGSDRRRFAEVESAIVERDRLDSTRTDSPLRESTARSS